MERTRHYFKVKLYILSRVSDLDDVDDLTQCVFTEFFGNGYRNIKPENTVAYLIGIARNLIGHYYSKKSNGDGVGLVDITVAETLCYDNYSKALRVKELVEEVKTSISKLPDKLREAVELRLLEQLSYREGSLRAGCSVSTFYERFKEGIKILKEKMRS